MPTNQQARSMASDLNGTCSRLFEQTEGNCNGWVSWWLRSRLQGREIWRDKYFERVHNLALYPDETLYHMAREHYDPDTGKTWTDRGLEKARKLQKLPADGIADRGYITEGVAKLAGQETAKSVSDFSTDDDNANNICRSFIQASAQRYAAKYSITSTTAHALGLDCQYSPRILYFDPNIGEFLFWNVVDLTKWWQACYQARSTGGGAFGIMKWSFNAEFYKRHDPG